MGCKRAREFLETHHVQPADEADASRERRGRAEALVLAHAADMVVVAKGKKRADGRWEARYTVEVDGVWKRHSIFGRTKS